MKLNPNHPPIDRSERLIELFEQVSQIEPPQRDAFLAEACGGDEAMRRELESLLSHANDGGSELPTSAIKLAVRQLADAPQRDWAEQQINQYRILRLLGTGGMGEVWLAEDTRLDRQVAIKFLTAHLVSNPALLQRFEREARAASMLNHPNIITVHEIGQHEETVYIAYEFVEGRTLRQRLQDSKPSWQEAVAIGAQIAAALKAAHSAGSIHRDIKPENVMLRTDGLVKVLDFGIAKRFDLPAAETGGGATVNQASATQAGLVLGTLGYLSPEQASGEKEIDARTDIFSLGLVMYEMLAGHPYAELPLQEKLEAVSNSEELPPIGARRKDIPSTLNAIVTKATRKARDERFSSAGEMLEALHELRTPTQANLQERDRALAQKRANQLLNQTVALYASDRSVRLSPAALWTVWRHSTVKRGRLESSMLRKSLFSALSKVTAIALLAGLVTLGFAAWNSIEEKWDERVLRDGHRKAAVRAAFSRDGQRLATYGADEQIIIWDFAKRRQISVIGVRAGSKEALEFSPDGQWLAHSDGSVVVIREAKKPEHIVIVLDKHQNNAVSNVAALGFSPDGKFLAAGFKDQKGAIWSVPEWQKLREFSYYACHSKLLFYVDNQRLLTHIGIMDVESGQRNSTELFCPMAIAPDNRQSLSVDNMGKVTFFDLPTFREIKSARAHKFHGRAATFSHDGKLAATGSQDIALWDAVTHRAISHFEHSDNVWDLVFSPDDRWLVSTHGDGAILVWDMEQRKRLADLAGHSDKVHSVAFSPSGSRIASASADQSVNIWNSASGVKEKAFIDYPAAVALISFLDEDAVLTSDFEGQVSYRPITPRQTPPVAPLPLFWEDAPTISPNKRWAIRGAKVYDWQEQHVVYDFLPILGDSPGDGAFSPDSRWLIFSTRYDGRMVLCEAGTWRIVEQIKTPGLRPIRLAFTNDNQWLITGCYNGEMVVWKVSPLRLERVMGKHADHIQSIAISPDGNRVVSASDDQTIVWWDWRRGKMLYRHLLSAPVLSVAFSPDSHQVVAGVHDKSVRIYTRRRSLWGWSLD